MTKYVDVTDEIGFDFGSIDGETIPIDTCVCGYGFSYWEHTISVYKDHIRNKCPNCGAKFYFEINIKVYQVIDD